MNPLITWLTNWRLLSVRTAIAAAFLVYTVVGFAVVPRVVTGIIKRQSLVMFDRQASIERVRCNPFSLSIRLEGFSIPDRPGSVLVAFDSLYANVQLSSLFHRAWTLRELQIDRPFVAVRRFADGGINFLEVLEAMSRDRVKAENKRLPRTIFQTIRIFDGRLGIEDFHRETPLVWEWDRIRFTVHDISTIPDRQGDNSGTIGLPGGGGISASGLVMIDPLGLDGSIELTGVSLPHSWQAIEQFFNIGLTGGSLDAAFNYDLSLQEDGFHFGVRNLDFDISQLVFATLYDSEDPDLLTIDSLSGRGIVVEWPKQEIHCDSILVSHASAFLWVDRTFAESLEQLIDLEKQKMAVETFRAVEQRIGRKLAPNVSVDRFEIVDSGATLEDRQREEIVRFEVEGVEFLMTGLSSEQGSQSPFKATGSIFEGATASADGTIGLSPLALDATVGIENLNLAFYQPYWALAAPVRLQSGVLFAEGAAVISSTGDSLDGSFKGSLGITDLNLSETVTDNNLIEWGNLAVNGIDARLRPMSLKITSVDIQGAGLNIDVAEDGTVNLLEFLRVLDEGDETGTTFLASSSSDLPPLRIARLNLENCFGHFRDRSFDNDFFAKIDRIEGVVSGIASDTTAGADVAIEAVFNTGADIRVGGRIAPFDSTRLTDLDIAVRDVDLPSISPMSIKILGHPINRGTASLDMDYQITNSSLTWTNHVEAIDLELGDKVEGQGRIHLPIKLAVSLLKDKKGQITLDIPLEVDLNDESFEIGTAIEAAVDSVMAELIKSPFRMLSRIGGSGSEDLEHIVFEAGSSDLGPLATSNLTVLATALNERPMIHLVIEGTVDETGDQRALQLQALHKELLNNGALEDHLTTEIPMEILTRLFVSHYSMTDLQSLESRHIVEDSGTQSMDEMALRQDLVEMLTAAQTLEPDQVLALGPQRAEVIKRFLLEHARVDKPRVRVAPVTTSLSAGDTSVACRLLVEAQ